MSPRSSPGSGRPATSCAAASPGWWNGRPTGWRPCAPARSWPPPRAWSPHAPDDVERLKVRSHSAVSAAVVRAADQLVHLKAQVRALSPQKTLDRGYAVVQLADAGPGTHRDVVRHPAQAPAGTDLTVRVAGGRFTAQSTGGQEPADD